MSNTRSKKISEEILHSNPWWTYKHDEYQLSNGSKGDYYYGETNNSGCAMIIPVLDDGRLVLVAQYRYLRDKQSVEFPCGGLNKNETAQACAERELLEETGYRAVSYFKIGALDSLNSLFKDTTHVFIANELNQVSAPAPDNTETIEILYRRPDEFETMVKSGEIWDGQTLAAWALARDALMRK